MWSYGLGVAGILHALTHLGTHWSRSWRARMSCVPVSRISQAEVVMVEPAKFAGAKELVPLEKRSVVRTITTPSTAKHILCPWPSPTQDPGHQALVGCQMLGPRGLQAAGMKQQQESCMQQRVCVLCATPGKRGWCSASQCGLPSSTAMRARPCACHVQPLHMRRAHLPVLLLVVRGRRRMGRWRRTS